MLRILIADDHPVFRRGLKQIIEETSDLVVAGEAADGREALRTARTGDYDVVLLDITMPVKNGVDVLSQLKHEQADAARPHAEHAPGGAVCRARPSGRCLGIPDQGKCAGGAGGGHSEGV